MKDDLKTTIGAVLVTATVVSGGFLLTDEDKATLEEQIRVLEQNKTFSVENVVDLRGTPVFQSRGQVTKVLIDGVEYLP